MQSDVPKVLAPDKAQAVVRDSITALLGCSREDALEKGVFFVFLLPEKSQEKTLDY